jgi:Alpha amylase, catalytic domain
VDLRYPWSAEWRGLDWLDAVLYEIHIGTFTPEGTFAAAARRLSHLRDLGVTAIEVMPVADFPGRWNWGYDGVYPYAPDSAYGRPADLMAFVDAAHAHGIAVIRIQAYDPEVAPSQEDGATRGRPRSSRFGHVYVAPSLPASRRDDGRVKQSAIRSRLSSSLVGAARIIRLDGAAHVAAAGVGSEWIIAGANPRIGLFCMGTSSDRFRLQPMKRRDVPFRCAAIEDR